MWDQHYRVLVLTAGMRERALASTLLAYCGIQEEASTDSYDLDVRYEALSDDSIASPFRPNFFVGAVIGTRGGTSLLTIRTFAARCFQGKRGSLWDEEVAIDGDNSGSIAPACETAVRALFAKPGGIAWQCKYDELWQQADECESEAVKLAALWLELPEDLRATVMRLP